MGDWTVALILLGLSVVILVAVGIICRFMGVFRLNSLFAYGDEKTSLTKPPPPTGYEIDQAPSDLHVHYDSLQSTSGTRKCPDPEIGAEQTAESPISDDNVSIASEHEVCAGLHRAMSCDSVGSDSSVAELESDTSNIGQLEFGLEYDRDEAELVVSVIQARGLEANRVTGTLDSYVKVWITPHPSGRFQTTVQRESTSPMFAERFLCNVDDVASKTLQFQVFSSDQFARHKLQGETEVRLGDLDLRQPLRIWMNLRDLDQKPTELGDIFFSLSYLPTAERLTVVIVKARNLKWMYGKDGVDCYVKVYLLQNGKKISKKKTSVKHEESSPIFNEAVIFNVPSSALNNVNVRITIAEKHHDMKLSSVGHVILGSQVSGTELTHWNQMMMTLRRPVAMWHRLRR